jgi:sigma-B regulation protein RsbU (phosphoserine phosphatase)
MTKTRLSLRHKILLGLTLLPLLGVTALLTMAVDLFEKDKIAYVFDSSLSVSKTKASRVRSEISSLSSLAQSIVLTFDRSQKVLSASGKKFFDSEPNINSLEIFNFEKAPTSPEKVFESVKADAKMLDPKQIPNLLAKAQEAGIAVFKDQSEPSGLWLALRFGDADDPHRLLSLISFPSFDAAEAFTSGGAYRSLLVKAPLGEALFESPITLKDHSRWLSKDIWDRLKADKLPEGIEELNSPSNQKYLVSFAKVGVDDLTVVSLVDRDAALTAVGVLLRKAIVFALAIFAFTVVISVMASRGLTAALGNLLFATQKVAEGDFKFRVELKSKDEFGALANSFNTMAQEVERLMLETAEKARMESELATAKTVQETLFPGSHAQLGPVQISGHYTPASECGGDWWYYCEIDNKVYLWIGDATGHGAPAALLTSAARAVASVIEAGPSKEPSESIALLNRAICDTSKGKMMMTFFLGCIDKESGVMKYVNASHEPPLLLRKARQSDGKLSRDSYEALNEVNNPRLGEQAGCVFKQASITLQPGDQFILYTDGVVDVKSPEHKAWGERKFLKALSSSLADPTVKIADSLDQVIASLQDYRNQTPLDDDVTLILVKFGDEPLAAQEAA